MIQRIQTVYLLVGAALVCCLFLFELPWSGPAAQAHGWFTPALVVLSGITALGAIGAVLLYRDRAKQRSAVLAVQMLDLALLLVLLAGFFVTGTSPLPRGGGGAGPLLAVLAPVAAYVCFFLARRGIERDIKLVRSMDRLR